MSRHLGAATDRDLGGDGAADLLAASRGRVRPQLHAVVGHVLAAAVAPPLRSSTMAGLLQPLLDLKERAPGRRGAAVSPATLRRAEEAYDDLRDTGMCHGRNCPKGSALRTCLDKMADAGVPESAPARRGMVRALTPTGL